MSVKNFPPASPSLSPSASLSFSETLAAQVTDSQVLEKVTGTATEVGSQLAKIVAGAGNIHEDIKATLVRLPILYTVAISALIGGIVMYVLLRCVKSPLAAGRNPAAPLLSTPEVGSPKAVEPAAGSSAAAKPAPASTRARAQGRPLEGTVENMSRLPISNERVGSE